MVVQAAFRRPGRAITARCGFWSSKMKRGCRLSCRPALSEAGYAVDAAEDGERADFLAQTEHYDAVVLDLGLPEVDGLTLLRRWRERQLTMPVLVLTARGSWHEKVQGIDGGADDYVAKPFQMEEVLARLRALIRRASGQAAPQLRCGAIALDPRCRGDARRRSR